MGRPAEFFKKGFLKILLIINTKPQKNAVLYLNIRQAIHKILQKNKGNHLTAFIVDCDLFIRLALNTVNNLI